MLAMISDLEAMRIALSEARKAAEAGEVPIGAVVIHDGAIISHGQNSVIRTSDPTAHAEIVAMRHAASILGNYRLNGCTVYVTLEPCAMCAGAMIHARIDRLVYGAADPKAGAVEHGVQFFSDRTCLHRPEIYGGIGEREAGDLLRRFFAARR